MTKVIPPPQNSYRRNCELLPGPTTERRWIRVRRHIPKTLSDGDDAELYGAIIKCCSRYLTQQARLVAGMQSMAAVRKSGGKGVAPLAQLAAHLRAAADIWPSIQAMHDDRLGNIGLYDKLEVMAQDSARRLAMLRKMKPATAEDPWPRFVVDVARACRGAGLDPTATGRVYEDSKPTWFQQFMGELDQQLLGSKNLVWNDQERDHRAFYAGIAKALRGDKKLGNPLK